MADTRKLIVEVVGDTSSLERSFKRSQNATKKFDQQMTGSLGNIGKQASMLNALRFSAVGAGIGIAFAGAKKAADAASDLNEQISKNQQVFGQSAQSVQAWSETTSESLGISQRAALEATGTFGNLFSAIGVAGPAAAATSKRLVKLAADLASFNNADPSEVLDALRSGLIGEAEPLRRFGVLLSEARVQQVALAQTGKTSVKALTDQEKALARVEIIMRDTSKAQGDFGRTSESLANQQRILAAKSEELTAGLGELLLPAVIKVTEGLVEFTDAALTATDAVGAFFDKVNSVGSTGRKGSFVPGIGFVVTPEVGPIGKPDEGTRGAFAQSVAKQAEAIVKPLTKEMSKALEEELLDAEIAGASPAVIRSILVKQKNFLLDALKDPRLKRPGRIQIKNALSGIVGLIESIDQQTAAAVKTASTTKAKATEKAAKDAADRLAKAQRNAADALQQKQFRALGLSATGEEPIPGIANLSKRINAALGKVASGQIDLPSKMVTRLKAAKRLIKKEGKELTDATRSVINDFIKAATGQDAKTGQGPLTATKSLNAGKLLEGLGLGRDMEKELRARLSSFNSAGKALAGMTSPTGTFRGGVAATVPTVVSYVTVQLDYDVVGRAVTRSQQKTRRRNPPQKRGPRSGI